MREIIRCQECRKGIFFPLLEGNVLILSCLACRREIRYTVIPDLLSVPIQPTEGNES